jgi:hypothetical protein
MEGTMRTWLMLGLIVACGAPPPPPAAPVKKKPAAAQNQCTIKTVAAKESNPGAIVADTSGLYWVNRGGSAKDGQLRVVRPGSKEAVTLSQGLERPRDLVLDDKNVYFSAKSGVYRVDKNGGDPMLLAKVDTEVRSLTLSELSVYWAQADAAGDTLAKISKLGGAVKVLVKGQPAVFSVVINEDKLYWSVRGTDEKQHKDGAIWRVIADGGTPAVLAKDIEKVGSILVDDTDVYFDSEQGVAKVPKAGGEVTQITQTPVESPSFGGHRLVVSGGAVFGATDEGVWRKDTKVTQLGDFEGIVAITVDDKSLYFTSVDKSLVGVIPRGCK